MKIELINADGSRTHMVTPDDPAIEQAFLDATGAEFEGKVYSYSHAVGRDGVVFREQPLNPSFKLDRAWIVE